MLNTSLQFDYDIIIRKIIVFQNTKLQVYFEMLKYILQTCRYGNIDGNLSTTDFTNGQLIVGLSSVTLFSRFLFKFNLILKEDLLNLICGIIWKVSLVSSVLLISSTWSKTQKHSGLYGCEVSADFPEYDTDIRRAHLHVFGEMSIMYKDGLSRICIWIVFAFLYMFAMYFYVSSEYVCICFMFVFCICH